MLSGVRRRLVSRYVLDASALRALLNQEPGAAQIASALTAGTAVISTVNFSEVVAKLRDAGMPEGTGRDVLEPRGLEQVTFDSEQAYRAGFLRPRTRAAGLGLGDRACLALA